MSNIVTNSKARHEYHILETVEAGIVLRGTEVKSIRAGRSQISDAFARVEQGQVWLHQMHIDEYGFGNVHNHIPKGKRRLLLNRSEIRRLAESSASKGVTLVPLDLHWKNNRVKVSLGVCKGKVDFDKRQDLKAKEADREMRRALYRRG